ncbi:MAG TPA: ATP synthase F1 subunit delta [Chloroflexota bacterium]
MRPSTSARRYAEAAFDVAQADGDVDGWLADLRTARAAVSEREAASYFRDPNVSVEDKINTIRQILPGVRPHVLNLLLTLVVRHRVNLLPGIAQEFEALERQARGIVEADVTVARQVNKDETRQIEESLARATGGKQVNLQVHQDPSILGGIIVRVGDRLFDASVRGRLERLRQELVV